jgi:sulfoxide reductase heme-binding subunit YedZ
VDKVGNVSQKGRQAGQRSLINILLILVTALGCGVVVLQMPQIGLVHQLALGFGYLSLVYIVVTLLIGPWRILRVRPTPVNINLRRDIGIWAAITGVVHVVLSFQIHLGGRVLLYFLQPLERGGYKPLVSLFGLANYLGLLAVVILILLMGLSNDLSLRWFGARRWKLLQRSNYILFVLVLLHTVGYQVIIKREPIMVLMVVGLTLLVLTAQTKGFYLVGSRRAR